MIKLIQMFSGIYFFLPDLRMNRFVCRRNSFCLGSYQDILWKYEWTISFKIKLRFILRNEKCTTKHIIPEQSLHGTLSDDFPWQMPPFASTVTFVRVLVLVPDPHFEEQLPIFLQADQTQLTLKRWNDWINTIIRIEWY